MTNTLSPIEKELLDRADSIFATVATAVGQAKDIAIEQLPDIAYQYLAFNRAYITFVLVTNILVWVLFQTLAIKWANKGCLTNPYDKGKWSEAQGIPYILGTVVTSFLCSLGFANNIKPFFLVWFAPKVFLLEHIITLIKH